MLIKRSASFFYSYLFPYESVVVIKSTNQMLEWPHGNPGAENRVHSAQISQMSKQKIHSGFDILPPEEAGISRFAVLSRIPIKSYCQ